MNALTRGIPKSVGSVASLITSLSPAAVPRMRQRGEERNVLIDFLGPSVSCTMGADGG
jgi:hypothetical protein